MASFSQYSELRTFLSNTSHKDQLSTNDLNGFIQQCEAMIARRVRAMEMLTTYSLGESDRDSGAVYDLPSDFLGLRSLYGTLNSRDYQLDIVSLDELRSYKSTIDPRFAAVYGYKVEFRGEPATDTSFDLLYFKRPAAFSADADTNDLLGNYPDLYAHGSLHWLYIHVRDFEAAKAHGESFRATADEINQLAASQRGSGGTSRTGNYGVFHRSAM